MTNSGSPDHSALVSEILVDLGAVYMTPKTVNSANILLRFGLPFRWDHVAFPPKTQTFENAPQSGKIWIRSSIQPRVNTEQSVSGGNADVTACAVLFHMKAARAYQEQQQFQPSTKKHVCCLLCSFFIQTKISRQICCPNWFVVQKRNSCVFTRPLAIVVCEKFFFFVRVL